MSVDAGIDAADTNADTGADDIAPIRPARRPWLRPSRLDLLGGCFAVGSVVLVTLWALHPSLLVANTLTAGGDTGAHVALPWFLRTELLPHGQLTGWYRGWFDGFPIYTYYFVLADLVAAVGSYVLPYAVAFKFATVLGSVLLPLCAYAMGRLFSLRAPLPAFLAAATLPFLFESSFTITGGNLFSTLAGEYAFSLGLALSLLALGLFARGLRTGRGAVLSAVVLSVTLSAHLLPWLWAIGGIAVLVAIDLVPRSVAFRDPLPAESPLPQAATLWFALRAGVLSLCLSAWWLIPAISTQSLASSMGYINDGVVGQASFAHQLFPGGDRLMLAVALAGLATAWATRSRFAVWLTTLTVLGAVAYVFDPQGSLWNERLLPFWFLGAWLTCGWTVGVVVTALSRRLRQHVAERWIADVHALTLRRRPRATTIPGWPAALGGAVVAGLLAMLIVLPPIVSAVPRSLLSAIGVTPGANEVPNWAAYNFTGYQGVKGWPDEKDWSEYRAVVAMMAAAGRRHGCGQSTWQYDPSETDFGTTESLMLLPYWTDNCIGSLEGLLFESSSTVPYHFLDQSELSLRPSDAMVGLPYTPTGYPDVTLGLEHLQLLGVRYFLCYSPSIVRDAEATGLVTQVATTGPWTYGGDVRTWHLFVVHDSPLVRGLSALPNVITSIGSRSSWQAASVNWWINPHVWGVELASSGPPSWPRHASPRATTVVALPKVVVTHATESLSNVRFHVSRIGVPVLVSVSYYPRWHVTGATGPYRVSPNLMVVVPTSHEVVLTYGATTAMEVGDALTVGGIAVCVGAMALWARRRLRGRPAAS
jgi:hypothetical protein